MDLVDGVIKFDLEHETGPLPDWADISQLQGWFGRCRKLDLIGQHADRYQGAAYGNISQRGPTGFLITGTQTGGQLRLEEKDVCWVKHIDLAHNRLTSSGPVKPSSESMTHEQVYRHVPEANFVIHVHHKAMWNQASQLGMAATDKTAKYGTQEMAYEVERLLKDKQVRNTGAFSMGGHEDGIVVFGDSADQAGKRLEQLFGKVR